MKRSQKRQVFVTSETETSRPRRFAPGDQPPDAFAHIDRGTPADEALGQRMVEPPGASRRQAHLARLGLDVLGLQSVARKLGDERTISSVVVGLGPEMLTASAANAAALARDAP